MEKKDHEAEDHLLINEEVLGSEEESQDQEGKKLQEPLELQEESSPITANKVGEREEEPKAFDLGEGDIQEKSNFKWVKELLEWSETLVVAVVFVVFLFTFLTRTSQVFGVSMEPTLHEGDVLLITRMVPDYEYGDIVVITKPNYFDESIVKRVVATEGQVVNIDFQQNVVYVDGTALEEPYINEPTAVNYDVQFPIVVPKGMVFVMGDNRNHSLDSRSTSIGMIDERYILGKAFLRVSPFNQFGGLYGE